MDVNQIKVIGGKKKNGHKRNCSCHICENMANKARRGGYAEDLEKTQEGGSKKKNGHRRLCKCPICKNMANAKSGGTRRRMMKNRKNKSKKHRM